MGLHTFKYFIFSNNYVSGSYLVFVLVLVLHRTQISHADIDLSSIRLVLRNGLDFITHYWSFEALHSAGCYIGPGSHICRCPQWPGQLPWHRWKTHWRAGLSCSFCRNVATFGSHHDCESLQKKSYKLQKNFNTLNDLCPYPFSCTIIRWTKLRYSASVLYKKYSICNNNLERVWKNCPFVRETGRT
jgi:hypothetical protein